MTEPRSHSIPLIGAPEFWRRSRGKPLFDVRSPGEFAHGHIPGAINLPLFGDDQRAEIGTIYKNSGNKDAMLRGLNLVGPKMGEISLKARKHAGKNLEVYVHCWRGGLRSESVAWLLKITGLSPIVLEGGYKAFRRFAQAKFAVKHPLIVVSGLTGAGKTDVLDELTALNEQVVDLETLANHRGSAFGSIGQPEQPSTEQFENELFALFDGFRHDRNIWVEDEGNRLGTVVVPPNIIRQIRTAPAAFIDSAPKTRVQRLMHDYGAFDGERLIESISNIRKRLGPQHADEAIASVRAGKIQRAIEIVLDYYDRTYQHAADRMPRQQMEKLPADGMSATEIARKLIEMQDKLQS